MSLISSRKSQQTQKRIRWIDYAKGIGIFFVVVGHVNRGLSDSIGLRYESLVEAIDVWIYAFHMPLFFFLSGLFAANIKSKSIQRFLSAKAQIVLYPYAIWTVILGVLRIISGQSEESLSSFLINFWRIIYQPYDIYWFLYILFLISALYFLLSRLGVSKYLSFLISILLYGLYLWVPNLFAWNAWNQVEMYLLYFVFGVIASNQLLNQGRLNKLTLLFMSLSGFGGITIAAYTKFLVLDESGANPILALIGIFSSILLAKLLSQLEWIEFVERWGYLSLQIYVAHTAAAGLTRVILQRVFHIDSFLIHLLAGTVAGITFPIFLNWITNKIRFPYLFTLPRQV